MPGSASLWKNINNQQKEGSVPKFNVRVPHPSSNQDLCQQRNRKLRQGGAQQNFFPEMKMRVNEVEWIGSKRYILKNVHEISI